MAVYGLKIFDVTLREGQKRTDLDFANPANNTKRPQSYLDMVDVDVRKEMRRRQKRLRHNNGSGSPTTEPGLVDLSTDRVDPEAGDIDPYTSVLRIEEAKRYRSATFFKAYYGRVGDHRRGIDPLDGEEDYDLTKRATARLYRAVLIAPPTGEWGLLAIEVISRSHMSKQLPVRLQHTATANKRAPYKLRLHGLVADEDAVEAFLKSAEVSEVEIKRRAVKDDSTGVEESSAKITFSIGKNSKNEKFLIGKLRTWFKDRKKRAEPSTEAQAVAAYLWKPLRDEEFDAITLKVTGGEGEVERLSPDSILEGFTYYLGEEELDDDEFLKEVKERVDRLQLASGVDLSDDWCDDL